MKIKRHEKGFALIEILIVIFIIALLFFLLIPQVDSYFAKTRETGIRTDFRSFQLSSESYMQQMMGTELQMDDLNIYMDAQHKISENGDIKQTNKKDLWGNHYEVEIGTEKISFASYGQKGDSSVKKYGLVVYVHDEVVDSCTYGFATNNIELTKFKNLPADFVCGNDLITTPTPPSGVLNVPNNFKATNITQNSATLSWDAVMNATSYILERDGVAIYRGNNTSFSDIGLTASVTYQYTVAAKNSTQTSDYSPLNVVTDSAPATPLASPKNFKATNVTETKVELSWDSVVNATEYVIERSGIVVYTGHNTSYNDTALKPSTFYVYTVAAKNATQTSSKNMIIVTTKSTPPPLSPPANFKATNITETTLDLTWDSVTNATEYVLKRDGITIYNGSNANFSDIGLTAGKKYTYTVASMNSTQTSSNATLSVTTNPTKETVVLPTEKENGCYIIRTIGQLQAMEQDSSGCYLLGNDIDATSTANWNEGKGFKPIGSYTPLTPFKGTLNGNGYKIDNIYINRTDEDYVGLFGYSRESNFENVNLKNVKISGKNRVGGLIGNARQGTIKNVQVAGIVKGNDFVGGMVGLNDQSNAVTNSVAEVNTSGNKYVGGFTGENGFRSTIVDSHSTGKVEGVERVGGFAGENYSKGPNDSTEGIKNSYATGNVIGTSQSIGGFVGVNYHGNITSSYANGDVNGGNKVGGFIGHSQSSFASSSYSMGDVSGNQDVGGFIGYNLSSYLIDSSFSSGNTTGVLNVGGFVGYNSGSPIKTSYSSGNITGNEFVGGFVGKESSSIIEYSYSTGAVTGDMYVGGFSGRSLSGELKHSYATGKIIGNGYVGGLIGNRQNLMPVYEPTIINNSYYDKEKTGQSDTGKGIGKTTAEMKLKSTYVDWDFVDIWSIIPSINNNTPYLKDNSPK